MQLLIPLMSGLIFGAGLLISGMADPGKVLGFLTINRSWNASLIFVMGSALAVTIPGFFWLRRRNKPLISGAFVTASGKVDLQLAIGSIIFGIGWGLAGYCPGPALVNAGLGVGVAAIFVFFMVTGSKFADVISSRLQTKNNLTLSRRGNIE